MHGHQAHRVRALGKDAARLGQALQRHRARQRLLPAVHPHELPRQRGANGGRVRQRVRGRHALPPQGRTGQAPARRSVRGTRRAAHRAAHVRNHHLEHVQEVDPELPRPAAAHQPVGERGALGDAHAPVPAHRGVPVARGPHRARHRQRGRRGNAAHGARVPAVRGRVYGGSGAGRAEDRRPEVPRGRLHALHRSHDAGRQSAPSRDEPLPRPELRQSVRRDVQGPEQQGRVRVGDLVGRQHAIDRRPHHDALGRQRPRRAAAPRAHARRDRAAGEERRRTRAEHRRGGKARGGTARAAPR